MTRTDSELKGWSKVFVFAVALVWLASHWNPVYVQSPGRADDAFADISVQQTSLPWGPVGPSLSDGVVLAQTVTLEGLPEVREDSIERRVCVEVPFVTFQRENLGQVHVGLEVAGSSRQFALDASNIGDWQAVPFCIFLEAGSEQGDALRVSIAGTAQNPDVSVAPLLSAPGRSGSALALPASIRTGPELTLEAFASGPLALSINVVDVVPAAAQDVPSVRRVLGWALPLGLPMIVAVFMIVLMALELVSQRAGVHRTIGVALTASGVLILTVGLAPASIAPELIPVRPDAPGQGMSEPLQLQEGDRVQQVIPLADFPLGGLEGDSRARRVRMCAAFSYAADELASDSVPRSAIDIHVAQVAGSDQEPHPLASEIRESHEALPGAVVTCFPLHRAALRDMAETQLVIELSMESGADSLALATRPPWREDVPLVMGAATAERAPRTLDLQLLREAPSYRKSVLARVGRFALGIGLLVLAAEFFAARRPSNRVS